MLAVLHDGATIDIGEFKAVDGGVVLFEDEEKETVAGFLPAGSLRYILSDALARERGYGRVQQRVGGAAGSPQRQPAGQQQATVPQSPAAQQPQWTLASQAQQAPQQPQPQQTQPRQFQQAPQQPQRQL